MDFMEELKPTVFVNADCRGNYSFQLEQECAYSFKVSFACKYLRADNVFKILAPRVLIYVLPAKQVMLFCTETTGAKGWADIGGHRSTVLLSWFSWASSTFRTNKTVVEWKTYLKEFWNLTWFLKFGIQDTFFAYWSNWSFSCLGIVEIQLEVSVSDARLVNL